MTFAFHIICTLFLSTLFCFIVKKNVRQKFCHNITIVAFSITSYLSLVAYFNDFSSIGLFYINDSNIHFIILTNFIGALVSLLCTRAILTAHKLFYGLLNVIFLCLNCFFMSDNLLLFYIFFEASAVPMFILIGLFGAGSTRHKAAYKFIIYSLAGSVTLLPALVYIYTVFGTLSIYQLTHFINISSIEQVALSLAFFLPFAIKMPIMPLHLWLPEAHVEAPTSISVLLAGLLLKTGSFAFYLVVSYTFRLGAEFIAPLVFVTGLFSLVSSSFYALVQTDIKKLIAYSSVGHMSLVLIGLFTFTEIGMKGAYLFMLSHGVNSAALFTIVGVLYDRGHVRLIRAYSGLVLTMPIFITIFFIMTLGNAGFPFTPGFYAEFLTFVGYMKVHPFAALIAGSSLFLGLVYNVWCFSRISFGRINHLRYTQDLDSGELVILLAYLYSFTLFGFNNYIILEKLVQPQLACIA